jgi:hypothetical protein
VHWSLSPWAHLMMLTHPEASRTPVLTARQMPGLKPRFHAFPCSPYVPYPDVVEIDPPPPPPQLKKQPK